MVLGLSTLVQWIFDPVVGAFDSLSETMMSDVARYYSSIGKLVENVNCCRNNDEYPTMRVRLLSPYKNLKGTEEAWQ